MVLLMVLSHIVGQSVLMVRTDDNRLSDLFPVDVSHSVSPSLMPDDHLILILFPPVILTWVIRCEVLSALLPLRWQVVFIFLHKLSLLEQEVFSVLMLSTRSQAIQSALIWPLKIREELPSGVSPHTCPVKSASNMKVNNRLLSKSSLFVPAYRDVHCGNLPVQSTAKKIFLAVMIHTAGSRAFNS